MTPEQTAGVLRMFRANWTYFEPTSDVVSLWAHETAAIDGEVGIAAAKRVIEKDERLPSIARFLAECQNVSRSRALPAAKPPEPPPSSDPAAGLAKARAALQSAKGWAPPVDHVSRFEATEANG